MRRLSWATFAALALSTACSSTTGIGDRTAGDGGADSAVDQPGDDAGSIAAQDGGSHAAPDSGGIAPDGGAAQCGHGNDACGTCVATQCCAEATACANDQACQTAALCVAAQCTGTFDQCAAQCNTTNDAAFTAYAQCVSQKGCGASCKP